MLELAVLGVLGVCSGSVRISNCHKINVNGDAGRSYGHLASSNWLPVLPQSSGL